MGAGGTPAALPPLYATWMRELLDGDPPREGLATCDDCAMVAPAEPRPARGLFFERDLKCCTYVPRLPNFGVGRILADHDPASAGGRASVEARIDARIGVSPLGLDRPAVPDLLFEHGVPEVFGRSRTLRCPHLSTDALCGIWKHRNGVCATWFCKYERGSVGQRFWGALRELLAAVEESLASWCLLELRVGSDALEELFPGRIPASRRRITAASLDGRPDEARYRRVWGDWLGREREFYRRSTALVECLAWTDIVRIGGSEVALRARLTVEAWRQTRSDALPERAEVGPFEVVALRRSVARIRAYSDLDPVDLPRLVLDALPEFDGRSISAAIDRIRARHNLILEPALVRRLLDVGVLVAVPSRRRAS